MAIGTRTLTLLALSCLIAPPCTLAQDTTATRQRIRALADSASASVARDGIAALLSSATASSVFEFPGLALAHPWNGIRRDIEAQYAGAAMTLTVQHVLVSSDGLLGCAIGLTRVRFPNDTAWRFGRYTTCWSRPAATARWTLRVHAQNGEAERGAPFDSVLRGPHSATGASAAGDASRALAADADFSRMSVDSGAGPAFARFAASDGTLLGARPQPLRGPDEIVRGFGPKAAGDSLVWHPVREVAFATGGLALTMGEAVHYAGANSSRSKYLTIWRLERDGRWHYVIDIGSARP